MKTQEVPIRLRQAAKLISILQLKGIDPILYGSLGASVYLGSFKVFGDTDLLIPPIWINEKWNNLINIMSELGYDMVDLHEHEFKNADGYSVAFAENLVLIRDNILQSLDELTHKSIDGATFKILTPESLLKAYEYSSKDGYRLSKRGDADKRTIELLKEYIKSRR